jgi:hypothetical protein
VERQQILCFRFLRGLTVIYLVGGLAIEDQQSDVFLWGWYKQDFHRSKQRTLDKLEEQIRDFLPPFLSSS